MSSGLVILAVSADGPIEAAAPEQETPSRDLL